MILLVDNYDSFTWNLVQALRVLGKTVRVARNDRPLERLVRRWKPRAILLSPGPGRPETAGRCLDLVRSFAGRVPMLGVCLGHQVIAAALGARIVRACPAIHGKATPINHDQDGIFRYLPSPMMAARYHSLLVSSRALDPRLEVSARTPAGEIMGLRARKLGLEGVQFHPESFLTPRGLTLLRNFCERT